MSLTTLTARTVSGAARAGPGRRLRRRAGAAEQVADPLEQGAGVERLVDEGDAAGGRPEVHRRRLVAVAGHEEDVQAGAHRHRAPGEVVAAHAGHDDVAEQQVDVVAAVVEQLQRLGSAAGRRHRVAGAGEDPLGDAAHGRVVLGDQDRLAAAGGGGAGRLRRLRGPSSVAGRWMSRLVPAPGSELSVIMPPVWLTIV